MARATELFAAIEAGDTTGVRGLLIEEPALAGSRTAEGLPAVLFALYRMQGESVDALLAAAPELDVFAAAALGRDATLAAQLAQQPAQAQAFSGDGFTALHLAAFFGQTGSARVLSDSGGMVNAVARNPMQVQPLHSAAAGRHCALCALLIDRGADVNARQQGGWTALHAAAQHGDRALTKLLLAAGAAASAANDDGQTAAATAAANGHAELATLLRRPDG